ncbi:serine O-acetyltransferase [Natronolimnobius baerhuensis]|uniref:Serine acetyltransferase n=1 Tax=Natronolimnobius baerhuensis TaxID=253108 RepID=A0A202E5F7_9EURY|nr:serine O-acetyltransferase [Natronolimnobius baerhuensis]OVE83481.1 serine O-acetyltransferase [Natronolimnobius baerhuensis]
MLRRLREDTRAMCERDPAAKGCLEVALAYPGVHAVWGHRLAHWLWNHELQLLARVFSHLVRMLTGVEIHPAATIGRRVTIDHGMGVVIGETAEVGDNVHMYHGVTLGGSTNEPIKRHPTLEDGVQIGANATLLGDIVIGKDAAVGAGSVVTADVESGTTVAGVPAERVDE